LQRSLSRLVDVDVSAVELDTDYLSVLCSVCADGSTAARWLRRLPEFAKAQESNALPIFLLPQSCAHQFARSDIAFAPTKIQSSLEAVARKALFGWEPSPASEPFFEIIARRNIAIDPMLALLSRLRVPLRELEDLRQFDTEVLSEAMIQSLDAAYGDFIDRQNKYLKKLLDDGVEATKGELTELENLTDLIVAQWSMVSENVQTRRVCVGNLRDLTYHPIIFMRPSFYCLLSIVGSLVMWKVILRLMKPKEVLGIWMEQERLL
jgi:hypothetical protein